MPPAEPFRKSGILSVDPSDNATSNPAGVSTPPRVLFPLPYASIRLTYIASLRNS
jgi:hypothetical protein